MFLKYGVVLGALLITSQAFAQYRDPVLMEPDFEQGFFHEPTDEFKQIVYYVEMPADSVGLIGVRRNMGDGNHDIRVGTGLNGMKFNRANITGVVAIDRSDDSVPVSLTWNNDGDATTYYVEVWSADNVAGDWTMRYSYFDRAAALRQAIVSGGKEYPVVCASGAGCVPSPGAPADYADRAVEIANVVVADNDICAVESLKSVTASNIEEELGGVSRTVLVLSHYAAAYLDKLAMVNCWPPVTEGEPAPVG